MCFIQIKQRGKGKRGERKRKRRKERRGERGKERRRKEMYENIHVQDVRLHSSQNSKKNLGNILRKRRGKIREGKKESKYRKLTTLLYAVF